jgi:hypothetical protein
MNGLTRGFWDVIDERLQCIGRGTAWLLLRRHSTTDESAFYAAIGGALVCAVCGGVAGFALSDSSGGMGVIDGTILGGLLGVCIGIMFGSIVETIDSMIKDLLRSEKSK